MMSFIRHIQSGFSRWPFATDFLRLIDEIKHDHSQSDAIRRQAAIALRVFTCLYDLAIVNNWSDLYTNTKFKLNQKDLSRKLIRHQNGISVHLLSYSTVDDGIVAIKRLADEFFSAISNLSAKQENDAQRLQMVQRIMSKVQDSNAGCLEQRIAPVMLYLARPTDSLNDLLQQYLLDLSGREINLVNLVDFFLPLLGVQTSVKNDTCDITWQLLRYSLDELHLWPAELNDPSIPPAIKISYPKQSMRTKYYYVMYSNQADCHHAWCALNFYFGDEFEKMTAILQKHDQKYGWYLQLTPNQYRSYLKCTNTNSSNNTANSIAQPSPRMQILSRRRSNHTPSDKHLFKAVLNKNWEQFVEMLVHGSKPGLRRKGRRKAYTVRLNPTTHAYEVVVTANRAKEVSSFGDTKIGYTKHTSTTWCDPSRSCLPNVFGDKTSRQDELSGIRFAEELSLLSRIFMYDRGTFERYYDFANQAEAERAIESNLASGQWHRTLNSLAGHVHRSKSQTYNEVLARLMYSYDSRMMLVVFSDNLETKILTQLRAYDLSLHLRQKAPFDGIDNLPKNYMVKITKYVSPAVDQFRESTIYSQEQQQADLRQALMSRDAKVSMMARCLSVLQESRGTRYELAGVEKFLVELGLTRLLIDTLLKKVADTQTLAQKYAKMLQDFTAWPFPNSRSKDKILQALSDIRTSAVVFEQVIQYASAPDNEDTKNKVINTILVPAIRSSSTILLPLFAAANGEQLFSLLNVNAIVDDFICQQVLLHSPKLILSLLFDGQLHPRVVPLSIIESVLAVVSQSISDGFIRLQMDRLVHILLPWACYHHRSYEFLSYMRMRESHLSNEAFTDTLAVAIFHQANFIIKELVHFKPLQQRHARQPIALLGNEPKYDLLSHAIISCLSHGQYRTRDADIIIFLQSFINHVSAIQEELFPVIIKIFKQFSLGVDFANCTLEDFSAEDLKKIFRLWVPKLSCDEFFLIDTYHKFRKSTLLSPLTNLFRKKDDLLLNLKNRALANPFGASAKTILFAYVDNQLKKHNNFAKQYAENPLVKLDSLNSSNPGRRYPFRPRLKRR